MEPNRILNKALAYALALILLVPTTLMPVHVYAATFSDTTGHWAEKYINSAISKGIVKGYADGTFKPDNSVTRAEFASMVNKALGNTGTATISFNDVPSIEWYYSDISKAVAATYVSGYSDSSFKPNSPITREEAAVIISRIVPSYGSAGNLKAYSDNSSVSDWAYAALQKTNGKGYIGAYDDGKIHPKDQLTRAQTAKIICDITDKETIVPTAPVVQSKTTLSNKIYSNGITIHKDLAENDATIDNCIVLGSLSIQGGGSNSIAISNSRIAACNVAKSSSSVRVVAKGETFIINTDVSNTAQLETSNLTGGDFGVGFYKINANSSSELSLAGSFPRINVLGSNSNVKLQSGVITVLDVSSSSRNSNVTVDNNGTVTTANVNGGAAFHGDGTVQTMNANANGITYEKKPSRVNVGSGVTTKPEETNAVLGITFDPSNGTKNVSINKKITITFSRSMTKYNGKEISSSDLRDLIRLTKESKSGTNIPFSASINSAKKVITITPDNNLTIDQKYYITIDRNVFKDDNGDGNAAQSIYFTVGTGTVDGVTFSPGNGATGVKTSIEPTITFDSAIETYSGDDITSKYLKSNIEFRKTNSSGSNVSFTASINSKSKVITIEPDSNLSTGQKYYLSFDSKVFRTDSDDKSISGQSVTWTAGSTTPTISFSPSNSSTGISAGTNISISFSDRIFNSSAALPNSSYIGSAITIRDNNVGNYIPYTSSLSDGSSSSVITLNPTPDLTAGHSYTISVAANYFRNSDGYYASTSTTTFTIAGSIDITAINTAITRANNAKANVSQSESAASVYNTVYWVTPAQMTTLTNAIAVANSAKSTSQSTAAANTAASVLDTATTTFELAKKLGSKIMIVTTDIDNAIAAADAAKLGIEISTDGKDVDPSKKWVTSEEMDALINAITIATKAKSTVQSDAAVIDAKEALYSAISIFNSHKPYGTKPTIDKSSLATAINDAKSLKNSTSVSASEGTDIATGSYWVSSELMLSFTSAIESAETIHANTASSQTDVNNAALTLSEKTLTFSDARQKKI